jgi:mannose-6-phosphate isomerase
MVWGSPDLRPWYDRHTYSELIGEVWLTGDGCLVETGPHAGQTLAGLFADHQDLLLGPNAPAPGSPGSPATGPGRWGGSPLLIKVIFAKQKLSVQVHPDDKMANKYGDPRGKTECWYALAAEPDALVACGLKPGVTLDQVRAGIADGALEDSLNLLPIQAGDVVFVDAGTVHAIWPGSILLETQQNCDLTYRMYDYGRPRELHIDKSLEATRLHTRAGKVTAQQKADRATLIDADYFCVERLPVNGSRSSATLPGPAHPHRGLAYLFAAAGSARLSGPGFEPVDLPTRSILAVPAAAPDFVIEDLGGLDLLRITPNWPAAAGGNPA